MVVKISTLLYLPLLLHFSLAQPSTPTPYWLQASAPCNPVPNNTLDVPSNSRVFTTLTAVGVRNWTCDTMTNKVENINQSNAYASATSVDGWSGFQIYQDSVAVWTLRQTQFSDPESFVFRVDPTNTYPGHTVNSSEGGPDNLVWGRWFVDNFTASGFNAPMPAYVTRTQTQGGGTPSECPVGAAYVTKPYTGVFRLYYCVNDTSNGSGGQGSGSGNTGDTGGDGVG